MFKRLNQTALVAIGLAALLASANSAQAQCSGGRGGGGGGPSSSYPASFGQIVSSSSPSAFGYDQSPMLQRQQMYALQQQLMQQRQQMYALQQQLLQQNSGQQSTQQQELATLSREQADQKKSEREERISALRAAREAKIDAKKLAAAESDSASVFVSSIASKH